MAATTQRVLDHHWQKPNEGWYICNIDDVSFTNENKYGLGLCIRCHKGAFYKGKSMWFEGVTTL